MFSWGDLSWGGQCHPGKSIGSLCSGRQRMLPHLEVADVLQIDAVPTLRRTCPTHDCVRGAYVRARIGHILGNRVQPHANDQDPHRRRQPGPSAALHWAGASSRTCVLPRSATWDWPQHWRSSRESLPSRPACGCIGPRRRVAGRLNEPGAALCHLVTERCRSGRRASMFVLHVRGHLPVPCRYCVAHRFSLRQTCPGPAARPQRRRRSPWFPRPCRWPSG